ncbi:truncated ER mannose-binding lectin [Culex quinquefasciatus]|uniref:Truncated ER mannose-binding lectin n=1 Tax=Culex quinquefasciatus TaxID=7176 RepID=B0X998_CULQU|nr:truncated ER mannose-binding lectin [Culex quinquefasciatus]|eukprot:XP_001866220.1 truncated ER mannose-binding lectin [Culex quinquefasciatus]
MHIQSQGAEEVPADEDQGKIPEEAGTAEERPLGTSGQAAEGDLKNQFKDHNARELRQIWEAQTATHDQLRTLISKLDKMHNLVNKMHDGMNQVKQGVANVQQRKQQPQAQSNVQCQSGIAMMHLLVLVGATRLICRGLSSARSSRQFSASVPGMDRHINPNRSTFVVAVLVKIPNRQRILRQKCNPVADGPDGRLTRFYDRGAQVDASGSGRVRRRIVFLAFLVEVAVEARKVHQQESNSLSPRPPKSSLAQTLNKSCWSARHAWTSNCSMLNIEDSENETVLECVDGIYPTLTESRSRRLTRKTFWWWRQMDRGIPSTTTSGECIDEVIHALNGCKSTLSQDSYAYAKLIAMNSFYKDALGWQPAPADDLKYVRLDGLETLNGYWSNRPHSQPAGDVRDFVADRRLPFRRRAAWVSAGSGRGCCISKRTY